jgi:hypothetical protein
VLRTAYALALATGVLALAACGGGGGSGASQAEVRALFAAVAQAGREGHFAVICHDYLSGVLRQLDRLVGGGCAKDLAREWREGVHLSSITRKTRIAVDGAEAVVYDGGAPDRARRVSGRWRVSEWPRNARLAESNEAERVLSQIDALLRAHHEGTVNPETGILER